MFYMDVRLLFLQVGSSFGSECLPASLVVYHNLAGRWGMHCVGILQPYLWSPEGQKSFLALLFPLSPVTIPATNYTLIEHIYQGRRKEGGRERKMIWPSWRNWRPAIPLMCHLMPFLKRKKHNCFGNLCLWGISESTLWWISRSYKSP